MKKETQNPGLQINLQMDGYYDCEIKRANGKVEKPWATPQKNAINPKGKDIILDQMTIDDPASGRRFIDGIHGPSTTMVLGTDDGVINDYDQQTRWTSAADRTVNAFYTDTTTVDTIGNVATIDQVTGNAIMTRRMVFPPASAGVTIKEVAFGGSNFPSYTPPYIRLSRTVLASPIVLNAGDQLFMTYTLVIPTLAITPQVVTIAAQNGLNLSGQLKLVGTIDNMLGGTVTPEGAMGGSASSSSGSVSHGGCLLPWDTTYVSLSTDASFPALGVDTTASAYNVASVTSALTPYTDGTHNRSRSGQFASGTARTFRSIYFRKANNGAAYQLLLDAEQTQAIDKTLVVSLNFAI